MFKKIIKSHAARRRITWIVAAFLILPFVLFFAGSRFTTPQAGGPGGLAGRVSGRPVSWEAFQSQYDWIRRQWESQLGHSAQSIPPQLLESMQPMLRETAWDRLILLETAQRAKLHVSNDALAAAIRSDPSFQAEGRFRPERYYQVLRAIGTTPQKFEALVRQQLLIQRLVEGVRQGVSVSEEDVKAAYVKAHERLTASVLFIDPASHHDTVRNAITEDELRADYQAHQDLVTVPEQLTFEYVGLTRDELLKTSPVGDEVITRYYAEHPEEFTAEGGTTRPPTNLTIPPDGTRTAAPKVSPSTPAGTGVSQVGGGARPLEEVREEIRSRLFGQQARQRLNALAMDLEEARAAGATLAEMAQTQRLEMRTVGPMAHGNLWVANAPEPLVLETAFGLKMGTMSNVVETDHGVYILRVLERIPSSVLPFEAARAKILDRLTEERSREAARAAAQTLRTSLLERHAAGLTFEEAARQLGVTFLHPAPFSRTEPIEPIGQASAANEAAFNTPAGQLTDVVETSNGFVVLLAQERFPADETRLAEEASSLREQVLRQRQDERLKQWLNDLRAQANVERFTESEPTAETHSSSAVPKPQIPNPK